MSQVDFVSVAYYNVGVTNRLKGVFMSKNPSSIQRTVALLATMTQESRTKMKKTRRAA